MFARPSNHDRDRSVPAIDSTATTIDAAQLTTQNQRASKVLSTIETEKSESSETQEVIAFGESSPKQRKSIFQHLTTKTAAALIGSAVMLPILAVGTATYYFGSQAVNKQIILARRTDIELAETEIVRQQQLLAALLIGTGTTALLAGAIAAWGTKRLLRFRSGTGNRETKEQTAADKFIQNLSQSIAPEDIKILKTAVEEVRKSLICDRAVVYSLDRKQYGVILAESVAPGYTEVLGKSSENPCFDPKYFELDRDGIPPIDNLHQTIISGDRESTDVTAKIVTPIVCEGRLFGLLAVYQDATPRQWQQTEIKLLRQLADQTGWALSRSKLLHEIVCLQARLAKEREWTNYFTEATQHIRQSIKQEDILEVSVEEVRRVLSCDRVVVYSLNSDNYGVVIAESVAPGYTRALYKTITDPCFAARYLDQYRDGRVRAIDNIEQAVISECYLEQLKTLEVKANLVTPILNQGQLFGLLVAHQCSQPRHWLDYEIRWLTQIATQVGFALDNAQLLQRAKNHTLATKLLNDFSLSLSKNTNELQQLQNITEQARSIIGLDRAIIYQFAPNRAGTILVESVAAGYPRALDSEVKDTLAQDYAKYRSEPIQAIANIEKANLTPHHRERLKSLEVQASLTVPIWQEQQLFGLLIGHQCRRSRCWEQGEIELFTQLGLQLGLALEVTKLKIAIAQSSDADRVEIGQQQISELLAENRTALQNLKAQMSDRSIVTENFLQQIAEMTKTTKPIAEATEIEVFKQPDLDYSTTNLHNGFLAQTTPLQLPMVEAGESLKLSDNNNSEVQIITGELVEHTESESGSESIDQFAGEISNLSNQISQQSSIVTESFQKLATFARQLSEKE
ncbi:GAF domain-containing protein [Pleurocapsales cyanobacterium LEGE 10410]|nr:GAF domain-containing protein [Pleurocapsales cyanobacterium LEGE 10410]